MSTKTPALATRRHPRHAPPMPPADCWEKCFTVGADRLTPLTDGARRLARLIALIDGARRSLRILYYIYDDDESGRRVRDALVAAAVRGVAVSLIVDGFGSGAGEDFFRPLEEAGASVCRFLPRLGRRYLLRNHQKLALADEAAVIVGGFNVADDYFGGTGADGAAAWRDLGLLIEGPAAARLAPYFDALRDWTRDPHPRVRRLRRTLARYSETAGDVRWLIGGPTRELSPWARTIRDDLSGARRLEMIAGYFAPNPANLRPVERVARRGGAARIVTAAKSDNNATIGAARHTYARLLRRGVRVAEYQPARLHTKLYLVDDAVHVGSANYDMRSLYLNLEMMLRVEDPAFAAHMRGYFDHEWADAREVTAADHAKAGLLDRTRWAAAYFLVAVLDANVTRRLNFGFE